MDNEQIIYISTNIATKLNDDSIVDLNDKLSFIENRQQSSSKALSETRNRICDVYRSCEIIQEKIKSVNTKMDKINNNTNINKEWDKKIKEMENSIIKLSDSIQFMQKFIED